MMDVRHYRHDAGVPESEKTLDLNQNNYTPKLEIFVRESIQNSLDAALPDSDNVFVDFEIGTYDRAALSKQFPELKSVFDCCGNKFISVSDKGTTGLTGPVVFSQVTNNKDKGKYISLVKGLMETSKDSSTSGGTWGLGKLIYYILGVNLVIFYSRIKENDRYESRLSAVWNDDGTKRFTPQGIKDWRGLSIWGKKEKTEGYAEDIAPVTDEYEIKKILDCFSLNLYSGNETGTQIIIPGIKEIYLNEPKTLSESFEAPVCWSGNLNSYLWMNIQKYYFPRLMGSEKTNAPRLIPIINGMPQFKLFPFFELLQNNYNATIKNNDPEIRIDEITTQYSGIKIHLGTMATSKYTRSLLNSKNILDNPYDLCCINTSYEDGNKPIILYVRDTGMISTYEDEGFRGAATTAETEYMLSIFRLDPNSPFPNKEAFKTVEEYVREGEKSDHLGWRDVTEHEGIKLKFRMVENIKKNILKNIKTALDQGTEKNGRGKRSTLGRNIADCLFPVGGEYLKSDSKQVKKKTPKKPNSPDEYLDMENMQKKIKSDSVEIDFDLLLHNTNRAVIALEVYDPSSESKHINYEYWKKYIGTEYPLTISNLTVDHYGPIGAMNYEEVFLEQDDYESSSENVKLKKIDPSTILITNKGKSSSVHIVLHSKRPKEQFEPLLTISEVET